MIEFSKPIKNDGSEAFRKCVMYFCLAPQAKTIRITEKDIEKLVDDKALTVIFEKTNNLQDMINNLQSCKERFSTCILKMVYLKLNPQSNPKVDEVLHLNDLIRMFANTENPLWGMASDESVATRMHDQKDGSVVLPLRFDFARAHYPNVFQTTDRESLWEVRA